MHQTITLSELGEQYLQESLGVINEDSRRLYSHLLTRQIIPRIGESLSVSESEAIDLFEALIAEGKSESLAYSVCRLLRKMLRYGASLGLCAEPAWSLERHCARRKMPARILTQEEEAKLRAYLLAEAGNKQLGLYLMLSLGLSCAEVLQVQWQDISFVKGTLLVRTERGPSRERKRLQRLLPLDERLAILLKKRKGPAKHYLCSGKETAWQRPLLEQYLRRLLKRLDLPVLSPTGLRHSYAVRCLEGGMPFSELAERLGVEDNSSFRALYREIRSSDGPTHAPAVAESR